MVCPPSISIQALIQFDMLQILLVITSNRRFTHSFSTSAIKASFDTLFFVATILLTFFSTLCLRIAQTFSIGLRSGLYEGHGKTLPGRCFQDPCKHPLMYV